MRYLSPQMGHTGIAYCCSLPAPVPAVDPKMNEWTCWLVDDVNRRGIAGVSTGVSTLDSRTENAYRRDERKLGMHPSVTSCWHCRMILCWLVLLSASLSRTDAWNLSHHHRHHHHDHHHHHHHDHDHHLRRRRGIVLDSIHAITAAALGSKLLQPTKAHASEEVCQQLTIVTDPNSYSGLVYAPPPSSSSSSRNIDKPPPLILVLHGAGRNDLDIRSDLASPTGEHAGLIPSLIEAGNAPAELLQNFAVLAPYSYGQPSFYQDSRKKLLDFLEWANQNQNTPACPISFDPNNVWLFGFSDGATVGVELLTTRRFRGGVICSYGYSGKSLPLAAVQRLADLPMLVFHSADDVIFDVKNSDRLVEQLVLQSASSSKNNKKKLVQYYRYKRDPVEEMPARVRGHVSMAIVASRMPEVYEWMLANSS
jgi:predicted esterase